MEIQFIPWLKCMGFLGYYLVICNFATNKKQINRYERKKQGCAHTNGTKASYQ